MFTYSAQAGAPLISINQTFIFSSTRKSKPNTWKQTYPRLFVLIFCNMNKHHSYCCYCVTSTLITHLSYWVIPITKAYTQNKSPQKMSFKYLALHLFTFKLYFKVLIICQNGYYVSKETAIKQILGQKMLSIVYIYRFLRWSDSVGQ